jgi:hypothetical protein
MTHRIRRLDIGQMAKVMGALYFLLGIIFAAIFALFGSMIPRGEMGEGAAMFGGAMLIGMPILYGIIGLIGGALIAVLYNLVAGWTGGIELEFEGGMEA